MKTKSVRARLSHFKSITNNKGHLVYYSRDEKTANRFVEVIDQGGNAVCLPCIVEPNGSERVVYHSNTIRDLVEFLGGV